MESKTLTIMFTDIKDFTKRTNVQSREDHVYLLQRHEEIIKPRIIKFGGKIIKTLGDSFLVVFESPTNALLSALEIQKHLKEYNEKQVDADQKIELKIGLNAGEVNLIGSDISGDPVNVASRIVALSEAGQIHFTETVYLTMNKNEIPHEFSGEHNLKGVKDNIKIYRVLMPGEKPKTDPLLGKTDSFNSSYIDSPTYKEEKKLDKTELEKVFDFTNVDMEKMAENDFPEDDIDVSDRYDTGTLELEDENESTSVEDALLIESGPATEAQIEHSKELLESIRHKKKQERRYKRYVLLGLVLFAICLLVLYLNMTKTEKISEEELAKESEVIQALTATKTAKHTPLPKSSIKPLKSISYGSLVVRSHPQKATIWLDGKRFKKKTPTKIRKVHPSKPHRLTIRKKGYKPYKLFFSLSPNERKLVSVELSKK